MSSSQNCKVQKYCSGRSPTSDHQERHVDDPIHYNGDTEKQAQIGIVCIIGSPSFLPRLRRQHAPRSVPDPVENGLPKIHRPIYERQNEGGGEDSPNIPGGGTGGRIIPTV